tara:strand:- start:2494 stop:3579 length:1086 start_codon:yes stop_codon:yes gene_type:complete
MYTELIKIIEGGLNKDTRKVSNYAKLLADNLSKSGDTKLAAKILKVLNNTKAQTAYLDELISSPVDQETRMSIVDFILPSKEDNNLVLAQPVEDSIEHFIKLNSIRNQLRSAGIDINSSMLLYGPPGCGKTTIAKHISTTLQLPLVIARLDSLVSSLLGNTSKNIRKVFEFASKQPCILFLDEFDAIAKARDDQHELGELKRVINSLLQNIDEFTTNNILLAATNHHELLDKAIWRRFNTIIDVGLPSKEKITELLHEYLNDKPCEFLKDSKKMDKLSSALDNQSPANIKTICQNAVVKQIIGNKQAITHEEFILEIFLFNNRGAYTQQELISYLNGHGLSQVVIKELCKISMRQVRNILK